MNWAKPSKDGLKAVGLKKHVEKKTRHWNRRIYAF